MRAARIATWVLVVAGGALLILAVHLVTSAFLERRRAAESTNWPSVEGRILSSIVASSSTRTGVVGRRWVTVYYAAIDYTYRVDGKRYQSNRIRFTGDEGSGARSSTTRHAAQEETKQYPRRMAVRVYYDPAHPAEAVLEPGLAHFEALSLHGPGFFALLALVFAVIVPLVIRQGARKMVAWLAERSPSVWGVAAEYGVFPPARREGLAPQPVRRWSVEARHTLRLKGRRVTFETGPCTVHTEGEFTGNPDLRLRMDRVLPLPVIVDNLRLKVPDHDRLLSVVGSGETRQGLEMTFSLSDIASELALQHGEDAFDFVGWQRETAAALTAVDALWGTKAPTKLGTVPCVHESET